MAGRKRSLQVTRPTGRRRALELIKNLLILLLVCSAVYLLFRAGLVKNLPGFLSRQLETEQTGAAAEERPEEAVRPFRLAVRNSKGLFAVQYDAAQLGTAFDRVSSLLGEGLATAGERRDLSDRQWQSCLDRAGVYCDFRGELPLSVFTAWLGGVETASGETVREILLSWDGDQMTLGCRGAAGAWAYTTRVVYAGHLEPVLEEFSPNGAAFAYSLEDPIYQSLDPYVLVDLTALSPIVYNAATPELTGNADTLTTLLGALGFQSKGGAAYTTSDGMAVSEGTDRLRVSRGGGVSFQAGTSASRYPVASEGESPTAAEAAQAAWNLLNQAVAPFVGESSYCLLGAEAAADGWTVTFGSRLAGAPVLMNGDDQVASFTVKGGHITGFTLSLRTYVNSGSTSSLLRERLAVAALGTDGNGQSRLSLCYSDNGGESVSAGWFAEE